MASGNQGAPGNPAVFSVQHFCLHDGPGVRSIVFFKGCPMRCAWCQNPESWRRSPEPAFKGHLCIDCKTCVDKCPKQAILSPGIRDASKCDLCFLCVENCPSGAMVCFGKYISIDELMDALRPEFPYLANTGGGVTFSGGEPAMFSGFIAQLAGRLHQEGMHIAVETSGYFDPNATFLSGIDLILFDIKLYDEAAHRKFCGTSNIIIKDNFTRLSDRAAKGTGPPIWPRLPLIPTVTDTKENLAAWAQFLKGIGLSYLTLVPYHKLGASKRQWLNLPPAPDYPAMTDQRLEDAVKLFVQYGISCFSPGEEEWVRIRSNPFSGGKNEHGN